MDAVVLAQLRPPQGGVAAPVKAMPTTIDVSSSVREVASELLPSVSADAPLMEAPRLARRGEFRNRLTSWPACGRVPNAHIRLPTLRQIDAQLSSLVRRVHAALRAVVLHARHALSTGSTSQRRIAVGLIHGAGCNLPGGVSAMPALDRAVSSACDLV